MMKSIRTLLAAILLLSLSSLVIAQDTTVDDVDIFTDVEQATWADPDPELINDATSDATIEAITDDSASYYGATVTIEGQITDFIGARMFEFGEDELLTNSYVLVVNNSSQPLPAELIEGVQLRLTGRVLPSFDVVQDDADWVYTPFEGAAQEEMAETDSRTNLVNLIHRGYIPDRFGQHTVFELLNVGNIQVLGFNEDLANE